MMPHLMKTATRRNLLLVWPRSAVMSYGMPRWIPELTGKVTVVTPALPAIAALTPRNWAVRIVDDSSVAIDYEGDYDLVGIGGTMLEWPRARQIATEFRKRGVTVVCGGPSVTLSPERWRPFSDVIFIGEAETTWPRFLKEFEEGRHAAEYRSTGHVDLSQCPIPDYQGYGSETLRHVALAFVQVSRGCPYACEFCGVVRFAGHKVRTKGAVQVVREVENLASYGVRAVFLGADNMSADRDGALAIFRALKEWNRRRRLKLTFLAVVSIDCARDREMLAAMAEAGVGRLQVGIESPNVESLKEAGKVQNVRIDVGECIKTFSEYGLALMGSMVVGFDHDDVGIFRTQRDFINSSLILNPFIFPLQAQDGTPLKDRIVREGRYVDVPAEIDPDGFNMHSFVSMKLKNMNETDFLAGTKWLIREVNSPEGIAARAEKFFAAFRDSPVRKSLRIPRFVPDWRGLMMALRLVRYLVAKAQPAERRLVRRLLRAAVASRHPQGVYLALSTFLMAKNALAMLKKEDPAMESLSDPCERRSVAA